MADWRDGVDDAPTRRPFGFAAPRAAALDAPAGQPSPAEGRPAMAPARWSAPDTAPLATLAPRETVRRDPHEAFDTDSAAFTGQSAWGSDAPPAWTPTRPLQVSGENPAIAPVPVPPGAPAGTVDDMAPTPVPYAPPVGQPVVPGVPAVPPQQWPAPPTSQSLASRPPVGARTGRLQLVPLDAVLLGCLLVGLIAQPLALPAIVAAWVVGRSRRPVRANAQRTLLTGLVVAVALGLFNAFANIGYDDAWDEFNLFARLECFVLMVLLGVQMFLQRDA